jgi:hypothetical protein
LSRHFVNCGQKDRAKFPNFDPCTVCGKTLPVSGGVYLPAFLATPLSTVIPAFWATPLIAESLAACKKFLRIYFYSA